MKKVLVAAALLLLGTQAHAADIEVVAPFMRAAPVTGGNGAAFLAITNHGGEDRLIGAQSGISKTVELHVHVKDGDIYRMRKVDAIAVPMHGKVELKPGGDHVMFIGLLAPVKEGTKVPLTLVFEKAGKVTVEVPVQAAGAMAAGAMPNAMPHHGAH
ncbi:MAG: copper chaperone PCu(A)C [Magnetospirillum sp.]|nr:MAG: copper chaperone PCu(A)C [Magnetospirillum sp.]